MLGRLKLLFEFEVCQDYHQLDRNVYEGLLVGMTTLAEVYSSIRDVLGQI